MFQNHHLARTLQRVKMYWFTGGGLFGKMVAFSRPTGRCLVTRMIQPSLATEGIHIEEVIVPFVEVEYKDT